MIYFNCRFTQVYNKIFIELEDGQAFTKNLTDLVFKHNDDFQLEYAKNKDNFYFPHEDYKKVQ